jgi:phosphotransferase system IIA component
MSGTKNKKLLTIASPISGKAVSLDSVPDEVFSGVFLGTGALLYQTAVKYTVPLKGR